MALEIAARGYVLELGNVVLEDTAKALSSDQALTEAYLGGGHGKSGLSPIGYTA